MKRDVWQQIYGRLSHTAKMKEKENKHNYHNPNISGLSVARVHKKNRLKQKLSFSLQKMGGRILFVKISFQTSKNKNGLFLLN